MHAEMMRYILLKLDFLLQHTRHYTLEILIHLKFLGREGGRRGKKGRSRGVKKGWRKKGGKKGWFANRHLWWSFGALSFTCLKELVLINFTIRRRERLYISGGLHRLTLVNPWVRSWVRCFIEIWTSQCKWSLFINCLNTSSRGARARWGGSAGGEGNERYLHQFFLTMNSKKTCPHSRKRIWPSSYWLTKLRNSDKRISWKTADFQEFFLFKFRQFYYRTSI